MIAIFLIFNAFMPGPHVTEKVTLGSFTEWEKGNVDRKLWLLLSTTSMYVASSSLTELCCSPIRSFLFPPISGEIDQWLANLKWRICSCPSIRIMKVSHELTNKGPRPLMPRILLSSPLKILLLQCSFSSTHPVINSDAQKRRIAHSLHTIRVIWDSVKFVPDT